jgi:hypothetical protein
MSNRSRKLEQSTKAPSEAKSLTYVEVPILKYQIALVADFHITRNGKRQDNFAEMFHGQLIKAIDLLTEALAGKGPEGMLPKKLKECFEEPSMEKVFGDYETFGRELTLRAGVNLSQFKITSDVLEFAQDRQRFIEEFINTASALLRASKDSVAEGKSSSNVNKQVVDPEMVMFLLAMGVRLPPKTDLAQLHSKIGVSLLMYAIGYVDSHKDKEHILDHIFAIIQGYSSDKRQKYISYKMPDSQITVTTLIENAQQVNASVHNTEGVEYYQRIKTRLQECGMDGSIKEAKAPLPPATKPAAPTASKNIVQDLLPFEPDLTEESRSRLNELGTVPADEGSAYIEKLIAHWNKHGAACMGHATRLVRDKKYLEVSAFIGVFKKAITSWVDVIQDLAVKGHPPTQMPELLTIMSRKNTDLARLSERHRGAMNKDESEIQIALRKINDKKGLRSLSNPEPVVAAKTKSSSPSKVNSSNAQRVTGLPMAMFPAGGKGAAENKKTINLPPPEEDLTSASRAIVNKLKKRPADNKDSAAFKRFAIQWQQDVRGCVEHMRQLVAKNDTKAASAFFDLFNHGWVDTIFELSTSGYSKEQTDSLQTDLSGQIQAISEIVQQMARATFKK